MSAHSLELIDRRDDRGLLGRALVLAVALHVVFVFVHLPEPGEVIAQPRPRPERPPISEWEPTVPVIPPEEDRLAADPLKERVVYLPDAPARDEQPLIEESVAVIEFEGPIPEPDVIFGDPVPPPAPAGPMIPGNDGVSAPVLILESKVSPVYPEVGRVARKGARVILRAVVRGDGTVGEVEVLLSTSVGYGFEQAAIDAVTQWLYEPGRQRGRAVDVYFTIVVEFTLQ